MPKKIISIKGMHCRSCELLIEKELKKIPEIKSAKANFKKSEIEINFDENKTPTDNLINQAISEAGYKIGANSKSTWFSRDASDYFNLFKAAIILLAIYFIAKWLGIFNLPVDTENAGPFVALLVGLVAGVSTCMALVGGLVIGLSARHAELHPDASRMQKFRPHLYFNAGRIFGYFILGGIIGAVGSAIKPSSTVLGLITILVGLVMIFLGLKLVEIFPALKNKSLTLPSSIGRWFGMDKDKKEYSHKAAIFAGALTFFLPCGFTQATQLYAVSTGSFWLGALVMGLFALGTAPGLLSLGGLSSIFSGKKAKIFFMTVGLAVIILGWFNLNNGRTLIANPSNVPTDVGTTNVNANTSDIQIVRMTQDGSGYHPNVLAVKKSVPVKWIINSTEPYSCASSIVMRAYGINRDLQKGENIIEFTPTQAGTVPFSCSMGMYRGQFIVTE